MMKNNCLLLPVAACLCAGFVSTVSAQYLEDVELRQEGVNAVLNIKLVTPVQYSRSVAARASDVVQVFYSVLPNRNPIANISSERRLVGAERIPSIIISDEDADNIAQLKSSRKLVIRFASPVKFRVRPGRNNSSIEVVLDGLGSSVKAATAAATTLRARLAKTAASAPVTNDKAGALAPAEIEASAAALLGSAQSAFDGGNYAGAIELLNQLLNLPPNASSRRAQELIGLSRLNAGDSARAASEFELFLKLYPVGTDSDSVRQLVVAMPTVAKSPTRDKKVVEAHASTSGSVSMFYYGGKSDTRTQEFKDSVLGGLPVLISDSTLSADDQKQLQTNVDLNWRYRDADKEMRFVFRDAYAADYIKDRSRNRLSALYFDYRSLVNGTSMRLGRQSPNGGGVLYRFDGIQAGYVFKPKWKVNAVLGTPSDALLDTHRTFYGISVDAEALTKELSGSTFLIQQMIDGEVDRRGIGADLRYFKDGVSASAQLDYDLIIKGLNIASVQGTWQVNEATVINAMADRRTTPILSVGNMLFFQNPALSAPAQRIQDLLGTTPIQTLREQVKATTPYQTQVHVGGTTSVTKNWQIGGDFGVTSVDAIKPNEFYPDGQASTGNMWNAGAQLIGSNLYSARDTHVFNLSLLGGPTYHGTLLSYNNLSSLGDKWQLEPSLKYYTQSSNEGSSNDVWTAGARATYRVRQQVSLETELTYEHAKTTTAPSTYTTSSRMNYYLGFRYDF